MDIDLTSVIISVIALGAFFVPVMYDQVKKKKSSEKFESDFLEAAKKHNLNLTKHDVWRNTYAIGLDPTAGKLLHFKHDFNGNREQLLDLDKIQKCRVFTSTSGAHSSSGVGKVELKYTLKGSNKEQALEFFNNRNYQKSRDEEDLAKKWVDIINSA